MPLSTGQSTWKAGLCLISMISPKIGTGLGTKWAFVLSLLKEWNEEVREGLINLPLTGGSDGNESACQCRRHGFDPWIREIPGRGNGNTLQYSCLGKTHRQKSLVVYSPWGHKESKSDMTEWLTLCLQYFLLMSWSLLDLKIVASYIFLYLSEFITFLNTAGLNKYALTHGLGEAVKCGRYIYFIRMW